MIHLASGAAVVLAVAGCGSAATGRPSSAGSGPSATSSPASCRHFSLSLAVARGGQPSPLAAAVRFANGRNGLSGWRIPASGWDVVPGRSSGGSMTEVRSGSTTLEVGRLSDGTWQVISGLQCR